MKFKITKSMIAYGILAIGLTIAAVMVGEIVPVLLAVAMDVSITGFMIEQSKRKDLII